MQEILEEFPSATVNNSRSIVRGMLQKMQSYPSESLAMKIEEVTGLVCDYQNSDAGNDPAPIQED